MSEQEKPQLPKEEIAFQLASKKLDRKKVDAAMEDQKFRILESQRHIKNIEGSVQASEVALARLDSEIAELEKSLKA